MTYSEFVKFLEQQVIHTKTMPMETFSLKEGTNWAIEPNFGDIRIKAVVNGPLSPKEYFKSSFRVLFYLREPYYTLEDWDEGWRGGEKQCIEYGKKPFSKIKNPTYSNLIKFIFYLSNMVIKNNCNLVDFHDPTIHESVMQAARNHLCVLNSCWFPHVGSAANVGRCIDWLLKNQLFFRKSNDLFAPNLILGAGVLKPQWNPSTNRFELFNLCRSGYITPKDLHNYGIASMASQDDHTFLLEDNKLYINTYHPQVFDPFVTARSVYQLLQLHSNDSLKWNQ